MMMFSDNTEDTTSPTEANCSLEELKENIQNDLDCLLGIYCEDNILESEPEIVQVAKHILEPVTEEESKASEQQESVAAQILQEKIQA